MKKFLSLNTDFTLSVKHDGSKAYIYFQLNLADEKTDKTPPIVITVDKKEDWNEQDVTNAIDEAIGDLSIQLDSVSDQIQAAIAKGSPAKSSAGKSKPVKKAAPKDEKEAEKLKADADIFLKETNTDPDKLERFVYKVNEWNKANKDVSPQLAKTLRETYVKLNELKDKVKPALF